MKTFLLFLLLVLFGGTAHAQVRQCSHVTPGHVTSWTTDGCVQDGGTPTTPLLTGGIGVANNNQNSICTQNAKTGAVSQLCLGSTAAGGFLSFNTLSGPPLPLTIDVNGVPIPFPGPGGPFLPIAGGTILGSLTIDQNLTVDGTTTLSGVANRVDIYATGLKADGVTSDDVALAAALTQCAAIGGRLHLPSGKILLTGAGPTTSSLNNCAVIGADSLGVDPNKIGTMIELTSTVIPPFTCLRNWSITGVTFYWPNQTTGTQVYPPLISDNGVAGCAHFFLEHVTIMNAWIGISQTPGTGWGDFYLSNQNQWALKDLYQFSDTGEAFTFSNVRFTPGPWLDYCQFAAGCINAVNQATLTNNSKLLHVQNNGSSNGIVAPLMNNVSTFMWRYFIYIDSGGSLASTITGLGLDGTGTVIDASSNGKYFIGSSLQGSAGFCAIYTFLSNGTTTTSGHPSCFNMGGNSGLVLNGFVGGSAGDFIDQSGGEIYITGGSVEPIGTSTDGGEYYLINVTSALAELSVNGLHAVGVASNAHVHGINTGAVVPATSVVINNNTFLNFNDDITMTAGGSFIISGNTSHGTNATNGSVAISGSAPVVWGPNFFDQGPSATASSCGTNPSVSGTFSGFIQVGSGTVTSCLLTLPFHSRAPGCVFIPSSQVMLSATVSGLNWTITSSADMGGDQVFFTCPGAN